MRIHHALMFALLVAGQPIVSDAAVIRYEFSGILDAGGDLGTVPTGSAMTGFFTYESASPDLKPGDLNRGEFKFIEAELTLGGDTLTIGSSGPFDRFGIIISPTVDTFFLSSQDVIGSIGGIPVIQVGLQFNSEPGLFSDDGIPDETLTIADFTTGLIESARFSLATAADGARGGSVTAMTGTVPLPPALPAFLAGLLLLWRAGAVRSRR